MSTGPPPWLAISTNSSEAEAPPVWISDTTRLEVGHVTGPATAGATPTDRTVTSRARTSAERPARRARRMRDLPAGRVERASAVHEFYQPSLIPHVAAAHRGSMDYDCG